MTNIKTVFGIIAFLLSAILGFVLYQYIDAYLILEYTKTTKVLGYTLWTSISEEDISSASFWASLISTGVAVSVFLSAKKVRDAVVYKYRGYRIQKTWGNV